MNLNTEFQPGADLGNHNVVPPLNTMPVCYNYWV